MKKPFKKNWRKPEQYESLKEISLNKWAWEFLRRNPEYCKEYQRLTKGLTELEVFKTEIANSGCRKWGLYRWLNPEKEYSNISFTPPGGTVAGISSLDFPKDKGIVFLIPGDETGEVFFRFDTRNPINPQIETAKRELLKLQKKQTGQRQTIFKPHRDEWILLIRILDAVTEGTRAKDIAKIFYPDKKITSWRDSENFYLKEDIALIRSERIKQIADKIKQAKRYADRDYRLIPFPTK